MRYEKCKGFRAGENPEIIGTVEADFQDLVDTFGPPTAGDGYNTQVRWCIRFFTETGPRTVQVSDFLQDKHPKQVREWQVVGTVTHSATMVYDAIVANNRRKTS